MIFFIARGGGFSILVFTRIGPVFSGREISACREVNNSLTCVVVGDDRSSALSATESEAMMLRLLVLLVMM